MTNGDSHESLRDEVGGRLGIVRRVHTATLQLPGGTERTFAVRSDVDLTRRKVGEKVVIRKTDAMALRVNKVQGQK